MRPEPPRSQGALRDGDADRFAPHLQPHELGAERSKGNFQVETDNFACPANLEERGLDENKRSDASSITPLFEPALVGKPSPVFESAPVTGAAQPPDVTLGGWSTPSACVRYTSLRGDSHRFDAEPRQDCLEVTTHDPTGAIVFAVADGVSSAKKSHEGARVATSVAVSLLLQSLTIGRDPSLDWLNLVKECAQALVTHSQRYLDNREGRPEVAEADLATTLTAGVAVPTTQKGLSVKLVVVGDSLPWLLDSNGTFTDLIQARKDSSGVFSSAVSPLPRVPQAATSLQLDVTLGSSLLVGSDGFGDPMGDGRGAVARHFRELLRTPPPPLAFAHGLSFSRELFDDDRSLIAIWSR